MQATQKHLDFVTTDYLRILDGLDQATTSMLESAPPPAQLGASISVPVVYQDRSADVTSPNSVHAVRKTRARRVPKGVIPGVTPPPDPERWLKKSERSTFQQTLGKKKGGGATQGIVDAGSTLTAGGQNKGGKAKKRK